VRINIKNGASLCGLKLQMRRVIVVTGEEFETSGIPFVITSGTDGEHGLASMHYYGYALDFRTINQVTGAPYLPSAQMAHVVSAIAEKLGEQYYVCLESNHLHIHFLYAEAVKAERI